eukprot:gb/GECG01015786.1/.p1 GENE.gb/GECG01015786.1/~~gb/GECG01015786.1/.p1  ORF type:complete len:2276 (+),score=254.39 gb/GECG01015786.1/:1-6828(+)
MFMPTKKRGVRRAASASSRPSASSSSSSTAATTQASATETPTSDGNAPSATAATASAASLRLGSDTSINLETPASAPTDTLVTCQQNQDTEGFATALEQCLASLRKMELRGRNSSSLYQRLKEITASTPASLFGSDVVVTNLVSQLDEISLKPMPSARLPTLHPALVCSLLTTALQRLSTVSRIRITLSYLIDATGRRAWIDDSECSALAGEILQYIHEAQDDSSLEEVAMLVLQAKEMCNGSEKCSESVDLLIQNSSLAKCLDLSVLRKLLKGNLKNTVTAVNQLLFFNSVRLYASHKLGTWAQTSGLEHLAYSLLKKLLKKEMESSDPDFSIVRALFHGSMGLKENKEEILSLFFDACSKSVEWLLLVGAFALENDARLLPVVLQASFSHFGELDKKLHYVSDVVITKGVSGNFCVRRNVTSAIREATLRKVGTTNAQASFGRNSLISYTLGLIWLEFFQNWSLSRFLDSSSWSDIYHRMYQGEQVHESQIHNCLFGAQLQEDLGKDRTYIQGLFQSSLCYVSNFLVMMGVNGSEGLDWTALSLALTVGNTIAPAKSETFLAFFRAECLLRQSLKHFWTLPLTIYNRPLRSLPERAFCEQTSKLYAAVSYHVHYKGAVLRHDVLHSLRGLIAVEDLKSRGRQIQEDVQQTVKQFDNLSMALREPKLSILLHCFHEEEPMECYEDAEMLIKAVIENRVNFISSARSWNFAFACIDVLSALRVLADLSTIPITISFLLQPDIDPDKQFRDSQFRSALRHGFWELVHENVILKPQLQNSVPFDENNPLQPFFEMAKIGETLPGNTLALVDGFLCGLFHDPEIAHSRPHVVENSLRDLGRYIVRTTNSVDYVYKETIDTTEITEWVRSLTDAISNLSQMSGNKAVTGALTAWLHTCFQGNQVSETTPVSPNYLRAIDNAELAWLGESRVLNGLSDCFSLLWVCVCPKSFSVHFWKNSSPLSDFAYIHTKKSILLSIVMTMYYASGVQKLGGHLAWKQVCCAVKAHFQCGDIPGDIWNDLFNRGTNWSLIVDELKTSAFGLGRSLREQKEPPVFDEFLAIAATQLLHGGQGLQEPPEWLQCLLSYDHSLYMKLPSFTLSHLAFCSASKVLLEGIGLEEVQEICQSCSQSSKKLSALPSEKIYEYAGKILDIAANFLRQRRSQLLIKVIMCHSLLARILGNFVDGTRKLQYFSWFQWILSSPEGQSLLPQSSSIVEITARELLEALPMTSSRGELLRAQAAIGPYSSLWEFPFSMKLFIVETVVVVLALVREDEKRTYVLNTLAYKLFRILCRISNDFVDNILDSVKTMQPSHQGHNLRLIGPAVHYWMDNLLHRDGSLGRKERELLGEFCSKCGVSVSHDSSIPALTRQQAIVPDATRSIQCRYLHIYSEFRRPLHWLIHSESAISRAIKRTGKLSVDDVSAGLRKTELLSFPPERSTSFSDCLLLYRICLQLWDILFGAREESAVYKVAYVLLEKLGTTAVELCSKQKKWLRHVRKREHYFKRDENQLYVTFLGLAECMLSEASAVLCGDDRKELSVSLSSQMKTLPKTCGDIETVLSVLEPSFQPVYPVHHCNLVRIFPTASLVGDSVESRIKLSAGMATTADAHVSRATLMCFAKKLQRALSFRSETLNPAQKDSCRLFQRSQIGMIPSCVKNNLPLKAASCSSRDPPRKKLETLKNNGSLKTITEVLLSCISFGPKLLIQNSDITKEIVAILFTILEWIACSRVFFGYSSFLQMFSTLIGELLREGGTSSQLQNLLQWGDAHQKVLEGVVQKYRFVTRLCNLHTKLIGATSSTPSDIIAADPSHLQSFRNRLEESVSLLQGRSPSLWSRSPEENDNPEALLARRCIFHTKGRNRYEQSPLELEFDEGVNCKESEDDVESGEKRKQTKKQDSAAWRSKFRGMAQSAAEAIMESMGKDDSGASSINDIGCDTHRASAETEGPLPISGETGVTMAGVSADSASADSASSNGNNASALEDSCGRKGSSDKLQAPQIPELSETSISRSVYGLLMKSSCDLFDIKVPRSLWNDLEIASRLCCSSLSSEQQIGLTGSYDVEPCRTEIQVNVVDFQNDAALEKLLNSTLSEEDAGLPAETDEDLVVQEPSDKKQKLETGERMFTSFVQALIDTLPLHVEKDADILKTLQQLVLFASKAGALSKVDPELIQTKFLSDDELLAPSVGDPWAEILQPLWPSVFSLCRVAPSMTPQCRRVLLGLLQMIVVSLTWHMAGEHNLRYMLPETKTALRTVLTADNQLNVTSGLTIQELRGWNGFLRILDD